MFSPALTAPLLCQGGRWVRVIQSRVCLLLGNVMGRAQSSLSVFLRTP